MKAILKIKLISEMLLGEEMEKLEDDLKAFLFNKGYIGTIEDSFTGNTTQIRGE